MLFIEHKWIFVKEFFGGKALRRISIRYIFPRKGQEALDPQAIEVTEVFRQELKLPAAFPRGILDI